MKPKLLCAKCGADVQINMAYCPSCGTALEWSGGRQRKTQQGKDKPSGPATFPVRNVVMLVLAIAAVAAVLEYATSPKTVPQAAQTSSAQGTSTNQAGQSAANMAALPHIQELETQLNASPENQELRKDLGNHLMDNKFYDRAIAVYRDYLRRDPKNPDIRVDMGICMKETGDLEGAQREMSTALTYQPKHLYAHFNLGIVYLSQGKIEEANAWLQKTVALDANSEVGKRAQQLLQQHNSLPTP